MTETSHVRLHTTNSLRSRLSFEADDLRTHDTMQLVSVSVAPLAASLTGILKVLLRKLTERSAALPTNGQTENLNQMLNLFMNPGPCTWQALF